MHIAFAVVFFVFVGLSETLRQGIFGLNATEIAGITSGALLFSAVFILRGDIVFLLRRSRQDLYGDARLNWTWPRSGLGLILGPALWILPFIYGSTLIQINFTSISLDTLITALATQVLLVALAQELFFREAVVKAYQSSTRAIYLVSGLAFFIFYVPQGVPAAMIAAGMGLYLVALRLIGTNVLVLALIHGATSVMFTNVLALGLTGRDQWMYGAFFLAGAALLSLIVHQTFSQKRSEYIYA